MSVIIGRKATIKFSRPRQSPFLVPVSAISAGTNRIAISTQTWLSGDPVWIVHQSVSWKASVIKGYAYVDRFNGFFRIHSTIGGSFSDSDASVIDLSEITAGPFAVLPEMVSTQLGIVYSHIQSFQADIQAVTPFSVNPLLNEAYYNVSLSTEKPYAYFAYSTGWTLSIDAPDIDTHSLGERFKTVSKDVLSGSGTIAYNVDFGAKENSLGVDYFLELMSYFTDEPDATIRFYITDNKGKEIVDPSDNGKDLDGDLYYEADILFTNFDFDTSAEGIITGSGAFVCTGPIRLNTDVNPPEVLAVDREANKQMPFAWSHYILSGNGGTVLNDLSAITGDKDGNVYSVVGVDSTSGAKLLLVSKFNARGDLLWNRYYNRRDMNNRPVAAVDINGNLLVYTARGMFTQTSLYLDVFRPNGDSYREVRIFFNLQYAGFYGMDVNPVTGHIYLGYNPWLRAGTTMILVFDKDYNYVRTINPESYKEMSFNWFTRESMTFGEDGSCTFFYEAYNDLDYITTSERYRYGGIFKTTADGIYIHKIVYYGSLVKNQVNWQPRTGVQTKSGNYIIEASPSLKLNNDLVPVLAKNNFPSSWMGGGRQPSTSYARGDNAIIGQLHVIDERDFSVRLSKTLVSNESTSGVLHRCFFHDQNTNRMILGCEGGGSQPVHAVVSYGFTRERDHTLTDGGRTVVINGSDHFSNWANGVTIPYSLPDSGTVVPYTQTERTNDPVPAPVPLITVRTPEDGMFIEPIDDPAEVIYDFGTTPILDKPKYTLFRFTYTNLSPVPNGSIRHPINTNVDGWIQFPEYDLDGKEVYSAIDNVPLNTVLVVREDNSRFTTFKLKYRLTSGGQRYWYSESRLTGFTGTVGKLIYIAVHNGIYDPYYDFDELLGR